MGDDRSIVRVQAAVAARFAAAPPGVYAGEDAPGRGGCGRGIRGRGGDVTRALGNQNARRPGGSAAGGREYFYYFTTGVS